MASNTPSPEKIKAMAAAKAAVNNQVATGAEEISGGLVSPSSAVDSVAKGAGAMDDFVNGVKADGSYMSPAERKAGFAANTDKRFTMPNEPVVERGLVPYEPPVASQPAVAPVSGGTAAVESAAKPSVATRAGQWYAKNGPAALKGTGISLGVGGLQVANDLLPHSDNSTWYGTASNVLRDIGGDAAAGWQLGHLIPNRFGGKVTGTILGTGYGLYDVARKALQGGYNAPGNTATAVDPNDPSPVAHTLLPSVFGEYRGSSSPSVPVDPRLRIPSQVDDILRPSLPTGDEKYFQQQGKPTGDEGYFGQQGPQTGGRTSYDPRTGNVTQEMNAITPKTYAPDFTQRQLDMLKWRTAYGMNHGQDSEALENEYQRGMQGINEMQGAFHQREMNDKARQLGLVQQGSDGQDRTFATDSFGKITTPRAGQMIDGNGNVTESGLGSGVLGKDPQGRPAMVHSTPYGYVYTPVGQKDLNEDLNNRVTASNNMVTADQQAQAILRSQGKSPYGLPSRDEFMGGAGQLATEMKNSPVAKDEQRRWAQHDASVALEEARAPRWSPDPRQRAVNAQNIASAIAQNIAVNGGKVEDYLPGGSKGGPKLGGSYDDTTDLVKQALKGGDLSSMISNAALRSPSGVRNPYQESLNKAALSEAAAASQIEGRDDTVALKQATLESNRLAKEQIINQKQSEAAQKKIDGTKRTIEQEQKSLDDAMKTAATNVAAKKSMQQVIDRHKNNLIKLGKNLAELEGVEYQDMFDDGAQAKDSKSNTPQPNPSAPKVSSKEEYDKLPKGAQYIDPNGRTVIKK